MPVNDSSPWVEKYRPTKFDDIVLDPTNKSIMENALRLNYFPNLLLYGPPGTGKTTTIINLVNEYQEARGQPYCFAAHATETPPLANHREE